MSNDITYCEKPNCPPKYRTSCRRSQRPDNAERLWLCPFGYDEDKCDGYWCKETQLDADLYKPTADNKRSSRNEQKSAGSYPQKNVT